MSLSEQSTREIANQVAAAVKKHARPWRAIIALILAFAAALVGASADGPQCPATIPNCARAVTWDWFRRDGVPLMFPIIAASAAAAFCLFVVIATAEIAGKSRNALAPKTGLGHAAVVRFTILLIGAIVAFLGTLALLKLHIGNLIVGGALTTILIGIAAQQSLGNVFAGLVLLFARPFLVGEDIVLRSGSLGGPVEGKVTEIGLAYVRIDTADGTLQLPNSTVLAAGVGHVRPAPAEPAGPQPPDALGPLTHGHVSHHGH